MKNSSGFTLIEVLITTLFLTVALLSTLGLFAYTLSSADSNRNNTSAQYEVEGKIEEICANDYATIKTTYTTAGALKVTSFNLINNLTGKGIIYAQELPGAANGLMRIKVVVCYRQGARVIGEDTNLNGLIDSGEDANGNNELDSPCEIERVVVNKES
jgi:Tfp pilus assembly protein PilE